jgi:thioester reductase-like protein
MNHLLLTGATGLLGGYLLADLMDRNFAVACLVRGSSVADARRRIDETLRRLEKCRGYSLPRPVVIQAELAEPNLGISGGARRWVDSNCSAIIHCAASLEFQENPHSGEPYRTNVVATRQLVELGRRIKISAFHHISTAYVCGTRRGLVCEDEPNATADGDDSRFGNDYERSKHAAEREVRRAADAFSVTVYRPSIIVGDSRTGYTSTYQGFYAPLRAGYAIAARHGFAATTGQSFLQQMGFSGRERKNLVPVDWVSAVITAIVADPARQGRTYHVTNPKPTSVVDMEAAVTEAIADSASARRHENETTAPAVVRERTEHDERMFREQTAIYRTYFRDDPVFDCRNTTAATPHLPCPVMDRSALVRLGRRAIAERFGAGKRHGGPPVSDAAEFLEQRFELTSPFALLGDDRSTRRADRWSLCVTGSGGGTWTCGVDDGGVCELTPGFAPNVRKCIRLNSSTWAELVSGRLGIVEAVYSGLLHVEGPTPTGSSWRAAEAELLAILGLLLRPASDVESTTRRPTSTVHPVELEPAT